MYINSFNRWRTVPTSILQLKYSHSWICFLQFFSSFVVVVDFSIEFVIAMCSNLIIIESIEKRRKKKSNRNWFFLSQIKWLPLHATYFRWSIIIHANAYYMHNIVTIKDFVILFASLFCLLHWNLHFLLANQSNRSYSQLFMLTHKYAA